MDYQKNYDKFVDIALTNLFTLGKNNQILNFYNNLYNIHVNEEEKYLEKYWRRHKAEIDKYMKEKNDE